jgi:hypothetical protein
MKFGSVKEGDTVYVEDTVEYAGKARQYIVAKRVIRVTEAQFIVEGGDRYTKGRGARVLARGMYVYAHTLDEVGGELDGSAIVRILGEKIHKVGAVRSLLGEVAKALDDPDLVFSNGVGLSHIDEAVGKIEEARALLSAGNKVNIT